MNLDAETVRTGLIFFILLASALCLRAAAQALLADRLGDPTPRSDGRVTLNPLPHVDFFGTVVLPLIFIFLLSPELSRHRLSFFLGWAKPVPLNPRNFAKPGRDLVMVNFAPFAMSVLLNVVAALAGGVFARQGQMEAAAVLFQIIAINSCLMVFDLLPVPPLPSAMFLVHRGVMSHETFHRVAQWSGIAILIAINLPPVRYAFGVCQALIAAPFALLLNMIAG
jgi:Zn-dependent protease